jgi:hypothetical protein
MDTNLKQDKNISRGARRALLLVLPLCLINWATIG